MARKPPTQAQRKSRSNARYDAQVNTFSVADVPQPSRRVPAEPASPELKLGTKLGRAKRGAWEDTPAAATRLSSPLQPLVRAVGHEEAYAAIRRPQTEAAAWMHARTGAHDPTIGPAVPSINEPHELHDTLVPQRRWEDMHPRERQQTLMRAGLHGVTMESATRDYSTQLDQAHGRAWQHGAVDPYSSRFYAGRSEPRDVLTRSAERNARHPEFEGDPHVVQAITNAVTSPRNKFSVKPVSGIGPTLYPNDEHANNAIQHVLKHPAMSEEELVRTVPNSTGPAGGGLMGNIRRATAAVAQLQAGRRVRELRNPQTDKQAEAGKPGSLMFGTPSTQKTTAYAGAWTDPEGPDAYLVTDVHTGHGFAAHLSTAKQKTGRYDEDGKEILGKSEVERYIESTPGVHAFHDYVARQVHAQRGLSPAPENAQYLHRGQASQWGEERIQRPDISDATPAVYREHKAPLLGGDSFGPAAAPAWHGAVQQHLAAADSTAAQPAHPALEEPVGKQRVAAEAKTAAIQAAKARKRRGSLAAKPFSPADLEIKNEW